MLVVQFAAGLLPTFYVWTWPSPYIWVCAILVAIGGTFSHFCMARAMLYADATIVVPMDFLRVPLSAAAGWLLYSERMDAFTVPDRQSVEPESPLTAASASRGLRRYRAICPPPCARLR
jgi:hypothetical protein